MAIKKVRKGLFPGTVVSKEENRNLTKTPENNRCS